MNKTFLELFAGVGGFRVGLNHITGMDPEGHAIENGDWNCLFANQWEPSTKQQHAFDCYQKRFPLQQGEIQSNEDISKVDLDSIPDVSLLIGGFPCQDYSVAHSLKSEMGIEGKKGVLFWDIARILEHKQIPFFLLENVDRLLKSPSKQRGRDFGIMLRTFHDLGYNLEWRVINAADYGCAQRRRRIFIYGWRRDLQYNGSICDKSVEDILLSEGFFAQCFPVKKNIEKGMVSMDLLFYEDTVDITNHFHANFENTGVLLDGIVTTVKTDPCCIEPIPLSALREERKGLDTYFLTEQQDAKFAYLRSAKKIQRTKPNGELYYYSEGAMAYPDPLHLPGRTMLTSEGTINRSSHVIEDHETGNRRFLTPVEAERLQAFPDGWTETGMPEKRRYFMMGNALVTKLISMMEPTLREIVESE